MGGCVVALLYGLVARGEGIALFGSGSLDSRVRLDNSPTVREVPSEAWVTTFADYIFFTVLRYSNICKDIQKIAQNVGGELPMDIAKILTNMSALLRGRKLTVTLDGTKRVYSYNAHDNVLQYEIDAIIVRPDLTTESSTHTSTAPDMPMEELLNILTSGEVNA